MRDWEVEETGEIGWKLLKWIGSIYNNIILLVNIIPLRQPKQAF